MPTEKRKPKCARASSQSGVGRRGWDDPGVISPGGFRGTEVSEKEEPMGCRPHKVALWMDNSGMCNDSC